MVSNLDIVPTILDLAVRCRDPSYLQGRTLIDAAATEPAYLFRRAATNMDDTHDASRTASIP